MVTVGLNVANIHGSLVFWKHHMQWELCNLTLTLEDESKLECEMVQTYLGGSFASQDILKWQNTAELLKKMWLSGL